MTSKHKRRSLAVIFNFMAPGVGYLYLEQTQRAIMWIPAILVIDLLMSYCAITLDFGNPQLAVIFFLFIFGRFFLSIFAAVRASRIQPPIQNNELWYSTWFFCLFLVFVLKNIGIPGEREIFLNRWATFHIAKEATHMKNLQPSLLPDEYIVVDKREDFRLGNLKPGSLVIYKIDDGKDSISYIGRVFAFGGDSIQLKNKTVYVNDKVLTNADKPLELIPEVLGVFENRHIQLSPFSQKFWAGEKLTVPNNEVFLISDPESTVSDSRVIGPVSRFQLVGAAAFVYSSPDSKRIGTVLSP